MSQHASALKLRGEAPEHPAKYMLLLRLGTLLASALHLPQWATMLSTIHTQ